MPHHYYGRTSIESVDPNHIEARIDRLDKEEGEPVPGSTIVLIVPVDKAFAHGVQTTEDDVDALAGVLLKTLEAVALNKEPER